MNAREEDDVLIEATLGAHRALDAEGLPKAPPEWWDLAPEARVRAFHAQMEARQIESALDPLGWNGSVRAVMARIEMT